MNMPISISSLAAALGSVVGQITLDIDGFLSGVPFLSALANLVSSVLIALFSLLIG